MAKHKLYRQFESISPLTSSLSGEISSGRDDGPGNPVKVSLVKYKMVESKCVTYEKSTNDETVTNEKTNSSFSDPLPGGGCASDSDSDDLFFRPGQKLPYSAKEDEWILKFVLKGQNVFKVGSISLWKHLESKKENPKRTHQSLKNRFLRCIRPHLFTKYRHLITSDTEIERILTKFPELKWKVGRTNTLSRIQLPARKSNSKTVEGGIVNDERVTSPRTSTTDGPPNDSTRREPVLVFHDFSNYERKVTISDKSVAVLVNFRICSKEQLHKTPSIGIYETYKKFMKKNKLVLCSACGRYNRPKKNTDSSGEGESLNFSGKRNVPTENSLGVDRGKPSVTSSGSSSAKRRKVEESEPRPWSPFSPSLLEDADEERGVPVRRGARDEPLETGEVGQAPEMPNSVALMQEADSAAADRLRTETDDAINCTYEDTVSDFNKLVKNDEEQMFKTFFHGMWRKIGVSESISQISMESYFVELSPNLETPELTIDYSSQPPTHNAERDNSSQSPTHNGERDNSSSLLARNMMKMLEETKTSKGY